MPSNSDPLTTVVSGPGRLSIGTGRAPIPGSDHYLVDLFTSPTASAPIVDVVSPLASQTLVNGAFVVRVSAHIPLIDPATGHQSTPLNCGDLITKKFQGLLTYYAGFSHVTFDNFLDSTGINLSASGTAGNFGSRNTIALNAGATLTTNTIALASSPATAIFTWEVYTYTDSDPSTGRFTRLYNEVTTASSSTAQVSFNNGTNFQTITDSTQFTVSNVGSNLIAKITNTTSNRLYIGAWAVVY